MSEKGVLSLAQLQSVSRILRANTIEPKVYYIQTPNSVYWDEVSAWKLVDPVVAKRRKEIQLALRALNSRRHREQLAGNSTFKSISTQKNYLTTVRSLRAQCAVMGHQMEWASWDDAQSLDESKKACVWCGA